MQPAHRRQDRGNSIGALHPEKVLSKAFRTRVRFPPPPPKRKGCTLVQPFLFALMGCWSEPASIAPAMDMTAFCAVGGSRFPSTLFVRFFFFALCGSRIESASTPSAMDIATPRVACGSRYSIFPKYLMLLLCSHETKIETNPRFKGKALANSGGRLYNINITPT